MSTASPDTITFIDGGLADIDALIAGLPAGSRYFVLDPARDGLRQMADALAGLPRLASHPRDFARRAGQLAVGCGAVGSGRAGRLRGAVGDHRASARKHGRFTVV